MSIYKNNIENTDSVQPRNQILYTPQKFETREKPDSKFFNDDCKIKNETEKNLDETKITDKTKNKFCRQNKNIETFEDCRNTKNHLKETDSKKAIEESDAETENNKKNSEIAPTSEWEQAKKEVHDLAQSKREYEIDAKNKFKALENLKHGTPEYRQALEEYNVSNAKLQETRTQFDEFLGNGRKAKRLVESDIADAQGLNITFDQIREESANGIKLERNQMKELEQIRSSNERYISRLSEKGKAVALSLEAQREQISDYNREFQNLDSQDYNLIKYQEFIKNQNDTEKKLNEINYHIEKLSDNNRQIDEMLEKRR